MPDRSPSASFKTGLVLHNNTIANMDFPDALRQVIAGHRITKLEWQNEDTYLTRSDEFLCIHKAGEPDDQFHALMISDGDLLGQDWVVLKEGNRTK